MKALTVTALLLLYSAASSALTADELQHECGSDPSFCRGYVQGVLDAQASWMFAYARDPAHPKGESRSVGKTVVRSKVEGLDLQHDLPWIPAKYCAPPTTTVEQLTQTTFRYVAKHPDASSYPADQIIAIALSKEFPCR